ncbi:unnamed protein product, partial [Symbiodinium necroappetens]
MCEMLREIKAKIFRPDVTRSGMLSEAPSSKELPTEVPEMLEPVHSDSSEGSADEEDDEATDEEKAVADVAGPWGPQAAEDGACRFARHKMSRCIHKVMDESGVKLKCGRNITTNMELLEEKPTFLFPAEGLETMGMFAFSCNFAPGAASETQIETTDESVARKLPAADRAQRLKEQQSRISGFQIRGPYEPGDSLVDRSVQMLDQDRLSYLEWGSCVSREHELTTNTRKDNSVTFDNNGLLRMAKRDKITPCDSSSELQVRYCLMRRGLALDQAGILTYDLHESLIEKLFQARLTVPPPNYSRVQMTQLEHADRKFFALLGEHTRAGIK